MTATDSVTAACAVPSAVVAADVRRRPAAIDGNLRE
jgi:hypothetical protein